jgi:hypothetical protein
MAADACCTSTGLARFGAGTAIVSGALGVLGTFPSVLRQVNTVLFDFGSVPQNFVLNPSVRQAVDYEGFFVRLKMALGEYAGGTPSTTEASIRTPRVSVVTTRIAWRTSYSKNEDTWCRALGH